MGVYVLPRIVQRKNGKVGEVNIDGMPQSNPIHILNDLIFLDELKNSLLEISDKDLDLSFFTKPNDSSYGNPTNIYTSFAPDEVLKCINLIKTAFQEREDKFVRPFTYEGIFDEEGKKLRRAFIEFEENGFFRKNKVKRWGTLNAYENRAIFQWYDDENQKWGGTIDLTKEKPDLYEIKHDGQTKLKGRKLNYHLRKSRFYDTIEPELENIKKLADYAKEHRYELQIIHG